MAEQCDRVAADLEVVAITGHALRPPQAVLGRSIKRRGDAAGRVNRATRRNAEPPVHRRRDVRLADGRVRALLPPKRLRDTRSEGVRALDLGRLTVYLDLLDERRVVAILGFFLEQHAEKLFVPGALLDELARKRPTSKV